MANISSNVIYVEPNYTNCYKESFVSYNADGEKEQVDGINVYEMAPPLEDYCVAFQLAVEVPAPVHKGAVTVNNTTYILSYESKGDSTAVSLMQGTRMPGTNSFFLTTAALETTLEDVKKASPTEMFGVKSIDISYDAWMTPVVTMKFTDIRGASVFVPEELRHPYNGLADDDIAGSFFRCFFVTPYPLFGLVVKGFYGEAVSYELMYSKFNYKLDSSTGNYEAEAQFIGYTWSVLADVTLNAVVAAPYSEYLGKEYWKKQVANGTFTVDDGVPMPTLAKVVSAYRKLKKPEGIPQADVTVQQNAKLEADQQALSSILDSAQAVVKAWSNAIKESNVGLTDAIPINGDLSNGFIWPLYHKQDNKIKNLSINDKIRKVYDEFVAINNNIGSVNQSLIPTTLDLTKNSEEAFKNLSTCTTDNDMFYVTKVATSPEPPELYPKALEEEYTGFFDPLKNRKSYKWADLVDNMSTQQNAAQANKNLLYIKRNALHTLGEKFDGVSIDITTWNKVSQKVIEGKETKFHNGDTVYCVIINLTRWKEKISKQIESNKANLEESNRQVKAKMQFEVAEAIGMAPTLYNMVKVIMAHLETLVYCVKRCAASIPDSRTFQSTGLNQTPFFDECSSKPEDKLQKKEEEKGDAKLPPFPQVKAKKKKDNRDIVEDEWLGDLAVSGDVFEVTLIESLLKAVDKLKTEMDTEGQTTVTNVDGTQYHLNCQVPVVPSDIFIDSPIFDVNGWDKNNCADIIGSLALRGSYVINAMWDNSQNHPSVCGALDAVNFYALTPNNISHAWMELIHAVGSAEEFADLVLKMVTGTTLTQDVLQYVSNNNIPWRQDGESTRALLDEKSHPNLPTNIDGKANNGFAYPIKNISFKLDGLNKQTATNDWDTFAYNAINEHDTQGNSMFALIANPNIIQNIIERFDDDNVKDIDVGGIKDNFASLDSFGKLNNKYCEYFNTEFLDKGNSASAFTQTITSQNDGTTNEFMPVTTKYPEAKKDKTQLSYTFPSDYNMIDGNTAFGTIGGAISDFEFETVRVWNGNSIASLTRDTSINIENYLSKGMVGQGAPSILDWTVPRIFGVDEVGSSECHCSIFTQEPYINAVSSYEKGILFLLSLDKLYNIEKCVNKMTEVDSDGTHMFKLLPYPVLLLLGGYYYWSEQENKSQFRSGTKNKNRIDEAFSGTKENSLFFGIKSKVDRWNYALKTVIRDEFECWVRGEASKITGMTNYLSFQEIRAGLEVFDNFKSASEIAEMLSSTDEKLNNTTFEKFIIDRVKSKPNFFKNYLTITKATSDKYDKYCFILWTRETSELIQKLTRFFVQPAMLCAFNEWLGLNGDARYVTGYTGFNQYMTGFYEKYKSLVDKTETTSENASSIISDADLNKHIKITLYNYIKILYDRWLSANLFKDDADGDHWSLKNFFYEHFHFIDQFYVDCSDIFFDMEGMVNDFDASFTQETFSLLSFIQNSLAKAKCVMYPVQNFLNYYDEESAKKMMNLFKPLSFNEAMKNAPAPNQIYPDFVVLYSSEPSSESDSECGDSMMLNYDEQFLPYPIRTNPGTPKTRIPAFGVTYGKQYQSYFHSIDVSTNTPIPTEQALKAQYMIAGMSSQNGTENGQQIQCLGQDLYTVFSKQSYTCTVQMMGDMWIQPTMYFVLTNVPTFRGSYMIQKVMHQITPGRMTTTIMGTRMASTTQPHVYNWYIGKNGFNGANSNVQDAMGRRANASNDCPYKVFGLGGEYEGEGGLTEEMLNSKISAFVDNPSWECNATEVKKMYFYKKWSNETLLDFLSYVCNREYNIKASNPLEFDLIAATMFNNYLNGTWASKPKSLEWFFTANQICLTSNEETSSPSAAYNAFKGGENYASAKNRVKEIFMSTPAILIGKVTTDNKKGQYAKIDGQSYSPSAEMKKLYDKSITLTFENLSTLSSWAWPSVIDGLKDRSKLDWEHAFKNDTHIHIAEKSRTCKWIATPKATDDNDKKTLLENVIKAMQKTCDFSDGINISKIYSKITDTSESYLAKISVIEAMDKPSKDNATLFDIALNGYGDSLDEVSWMVKDANSGGELPICVELRIYKEKIQIHSANMRWSDAEGAYLIYDNITACPNCVGILNDYFYRSIAKKWLNGNELDKDFFKRVITFRKFQEQKDNVVGILSLNKPEPCVGGTASWAGPILGGIPERDGFWWELSSDVYPPKN